MQNLIIWKFKSTKNCIPVEEGFFLMILMFVQIMYIFFNMAKIRHFWLVILLLISKTETNRQVLHTKYQIWNFHSKCFNSSYINQQYCNFNGSTLLNMNFMKARFNFMHNSSFLKRLLHKICIPMLPQCFITLTHCGMVVLCSGKFWPREKFERLRRGFVVLFLLLGTLSES